MSLLPTGLAPGNYTFTVTDANGCSITVRATITQPNAFAVDKLVTDVKCNGASTGSIDLAVTGGTKPYAYVWSNGARTEDIAGLAAGNYSVTVTDSEGCAYTGDVVITQPPALGAMQVVTNVQCNGASTGAIDITVAGGTAPYSYAWSNGAKTKSLTGLAAGSYTFTATDSAGCTTGGTAVITEPAALTAAQAVTNVQCNGGSTGSVVISPSGGAAPYNITPSQTGLAAGSYTFTVTDANNCSINVPVSIVQPAALAATKAVTNVACNGASTGSIDLAVSGGTSPYSYSWSNGAQTKDFTGLAAGSYTAMITDAHGCSVKVVVTITEPAPLTATDTVRNIKCNGTATGSVVITPSGGVAPYIITPAQTGLAAGNYMFTVTDANNCSVIVPVTISQHALLATSQAVTNVQCNGASTGAVDITTTGGAAPYLYSWSNGAKTEDLTGLAAGTYTFAVMDSAGCSAAGTVIITQPSALTATKTVSNVACHGASTGSVSIMPSGGLAPYTITPAQTGLAAGSYIFTVTDANNCVVIMGSVRLCNLLP